jgi:hypothetical protein
VYARFRILITSSTRKFSRREGLPLWVIQLLAVDYQLEIRIDRPADLDRVVEFFERSAYAPEPVNERTIALTPPEPLDLQLARRELEIYLRILGRVHPGVAATLTA